MTQENPFGFESSDDSTGFLLWRTHNFWQREFRKCLKEFDLTHTQFVILASSHWLNLQNEEVTQIEIADHAKTDVMLTSNVIRALEKKQFLSRAEHSSDTRAKKVFLTDLGIEILKKAVKKVEKFDQIFFSKLSDSKKFNEELIKLTENNPPA